MIKTVTTTILNLIKTRANGDLSNLTSLGEQKLRLSRSVAGYYVGDIGIAIGGIDENEGTRKYLNGQKVSLEKLPDFKEWLKKRKKASPSAFVSSQAEWNAERDKSHFKQCGKFFYDEAGDYVILPRIVFIQGSTDITALGKLTPAGLPNIRAQMSNESGVLDNSMGSGSSKWENYWWNASAWNSIYGRSDTVQPETLSYPYFIQVSVDAEPVTSVLNDLDMDLNNPFSLFDIRWSDHRIDNLSWLISNGQLNESSAYPSAYEFLMDQYNHGTEKVDTITYASRINITERVTVSMSYRVGKNGMKITKDKETYDKLVRETGTAWYYLLSPNGDGFYLPQTDGCLQGGLTANLGQFTPAGIPNIKGQISGLSYDTQHSKDGMRGPFYWGTASCNGAGTGESDRYGYFDASLVSAIYSDGVTTVQPNGVRGYLYFYVGECVQGANIINFEGIKAQLTNELTTTLDSMSAHRVISSYKNENSWCREYADGWCEQGGLTVIDKTDYQDIILLIPYKDTSYTIVTGVEYTASADTVPGIVTAEKKVGSFRINDVTNQNYRTYWQTAGYIR